MERIHFVLLVLIAMWIQLAQGTEKPTLIERPNADSGPTEISVGMWVVEISKTLRRVPNEAKVANCS